MENYIVKKMGLIGDAYNKFIAFMQKPLTGFVILLVASIILFAQCVMTLNVAKQNTNPAEKDKEGLRHVTGLTLFVAIVLVGYAFIKIACNYTPLQYTMACNLNELKSAGFGLISSLSSKAAAAASAASAAAKQQ